MTASEQRQDKQPRVVWFAPFFSSEQEERAGWLQSCGYQVQVVRKLSELSELALRGQFERLVVGDHSQGHEFRRNLQAMQHWPMFTALKTVVCLAGDDPGLYELAALHQVRDIVPSDLPQAEWRYRMQFALASHAAAIDLPQAAPVANAPVSLKAPGRILAFEAYRGEHGPEILVELEAPLRPNLGSQFILACPSLQKLSQTWVRLKVEAIWHERLAYRFKNAMRARVEAPLSIREQLWNKLHEMQHLDCGPLDTVFVVGQSYGFRRRLYHRLNKPGIRTVTALKFSQLASMPPYLGAKLVVVEASLCLAQHRSRLERLIASLPTKTALIAFGALAPEAQAALHMLARDHDLYFCEQDHDDQLASLCQRLLKHNPDGKPTSAPLRIRFAANNAHSYARLHIPGELSAMHPQFVTIQPAFPIDAFALVQMQAPWCKDLLGRHPWLKAVDSAAASTQAGRYLFAEMGEGEREHWSMGLQARGLLPTLHQAPWRPGSWQPTAPLVRRHLGPHGRAPTAQPDKSLVVSRLPSQTPLLGSAKQEWAWLGLSLLATLTALGVALIFSWP